MREEKFIWNFQRKSGNYYLEQFGRFFWKWCKIFEASIHNMYVRTWMEHKKFTVFDVDVVVNDIDVSFSVKQSWYDVPTTKERLNERTLTTFNETLPRDVAGDGSLHLFHSKVDYFL